MSGYPENFDGAPRPTVTDEQIRVARAKVALPITFLILNGLLGVIVMGALAGIQASNPLLPVEMLRKMNAENPDAAKKEDTDKKIQELEDKINADIPGARQSIALRGAFLCGTNSLAILGAVMLRVTNRRGWGYVSAIVSMIPLVTGLCCTGLPFGLWALIVLGMPSVADGLGEARRRATTPNPDGY
jgi:hypothetical protein